MAHFVTCYYCKERFNRDIEPTVQVSARRYAHKKCAEEKEKEKTQEERDIEELELYIMKLFNEPFVNARIKKQIKDFHKNYNYSYSGMLKTLIWFYEIKGRSLEKANGGIGIIPFVYKEASEYYSRISSIKEVNKTKDVQKYKAKEKIIEIYSPFAEVKPHKTFNLDE